VERFKRIYARELEMAAKFVGVDALEVRFGLICYYS
jgi:hypothetical protein